MINNEHKLITCTFEIKCTMLARLPFFQQDKYINEYLQNEGLHIATMSEDKEIIVKNWSIIK